MPTISSIRENIALCYGHYNHKSHTCLFNENNPICIQCRRYTMSCLGKKGGRPRARTIDDIIQEQTVAAVKIKKTDENSMSYPELLRLFRQHRETTFIINRVNAMKQSP